MGSVSRCAALSALLVACLPDNPDGDSDGTSGAGTDSDTDTDGPPPVPETSILGCPAGQTCPMIFVAQTFDDRIEIFAPEDATNAYRGALDFDFRAGIDNDTLDEPFGIALSDGFLHVIAGHYPTREEGTMVSLPRELLGEYDAGATVPATAMIAGGAVQAPVVGTPFGVLEPIFLNRRPVGGRLLLGTFNNDLFSTENTWTQPGILHVIDASEPSQFAAFDLSTISGGACLGAAEVIVFPGGIEAAVACEGNEAIAFLNLGDLAAGTVQDAAAGISGTLCDLPPMDSRRTRYLAPAEDGVVVGVGPAVLDTIGSSQIYFVGTDCSTNELPIGMNGEAIPSQIVRRGEDWLVASASFLEEANRGIYVLRGTGLCDDPIAGFDWDTPVPGRPNDPLALALSADGDHLAVGTGPLRASDTPADTAYGQVLWVTLEGFGCETTASSIVDLTDGAAGHAPAPNPVDPTTVRQQPYVVVLDEVQG